MAASIETSLVVLNRGSGPVKELARDVRRLDSDARKAGDSLDRMAGLGNASKLEADARAANSLASGLKDVRQEVGKLAPAWQRHDSWLNRVERSTKRTRIETDRLGVSLRELGAIDARPRIQIDGIAQARVELAELRAEVAAFNRTRSSASASVNTRTTNINSTSVVGGGSGGRSGVRVGRFSGRTILAGAAVGLPGAQGLIGGAAGILGSGGAAGLGAGAVGGAGLAVGAAGLASFLAIAKPAQKVMEDGAKAQTAWTDAVRDFGVGSTEAKKAKEEYDRSLADNPGMRKALSETRAFNREWREATKPGRQDYFGLRADRARAGQRMSGFLGGVSNRATGAVRDAQQSQLDRLATPGAMANVDRITRVFVNDLPIAERSLGHIEMSMLNLVRASLPFFHEANLWVETQSEGWETASSDIGGTRDKIHGLVEDTKDWGDMLGSAWDLLKDIGGAGRPAGGSLVRDFTDTLDRWDTWVKTNPRQTGKWFSDTAEATGDIADALGDAVHWLDDMATRLQPLLSGFTGLVSAASGLGLLVPGASALLLGGVRGARASGAGVNSGGGSPSGGSGGGAPIILGAGLGMAGAAGVAGYRGVGAPGAGFNRYAAGLGQPMGPMRQPSAGAGGARYGAPVSELGARSGEFGARGAKVAGAARGAGRMFLPAATAFGAIQAYGFEGDAWDKAQMFGNSLTLGAIRRPQTREQRWDRSGEVTDAFLQGNVDGLGNNYFGHQKGLSRIDAETARLQARLGASKRNEIGNAQGVGIALDFNASGTTKREREGLRQRIDLLGEERKALAKTNAEMRRGLDDRHATESRKHGAQLTDSFGKGYDVLAAKYGDEKAMSKTLSGPNGVLAKLRTMRPEGAKVLGENTLAWAQAQADANPKLQKQVDKLANGIERRFSRLGSRVQVVNGQILTGTSREWKNIGKSMSDPAEIALQDVTDAFTAIQQQASGSLQAMGFTPGSANKLVRDIARGNKENASKSDKNAGATATGIIDLTRIGQQISGGGPAGDGIGFTGDGPGMGDHMRSSSAGTAAPASNGINLMGAKAGLAPYAQEASRFGLRVSSGGRPGAITSSGNKSFHASGDALDLAGSPDKMMQFAQYAASNWGSHLEELIYTPFGQGQIKNGSPYVYTGQVAADHFDHVHIADTAPSLDGSGAGGGPSMDYSPDTAGPGLQKISLDAPKSGATGIAGTLADLASGSFAAGLEKKINDAIGAGGGAGGPMGGGDGTLSFDDAAKLFESVGLPGVTFAQIAQGESALRIGAVGHDPGGTQGLGLLQITTGFNDDLIAKYGGRDAMLSNPRANAMAGKEIYDRQGIGAWYGDKFVTDPNAHYQGDGIGHTPVAWGGWHKAGVNQTFDKPTMIGVAENGREHVKVTPFGQSSGGSGTLVKVVLESGAIQVAGGSGIPAGLDAWLEGKLVALANEVAGYVGGGSMESTSALMS